MGFCSAVRRRWPAGLAGAVAAAAGLAAAGVVSALLGSRGQPVTVVAAAIVDLVPPWLKDLAIAWFGFADKAVLVSGVLLGVALLAVGAGLVGERRRGLGLGLAALAPGLAVLAALTRPASGPYDALPALLGGAMGLIMLSWLLDRLAASAPSADEGGMGSSRRAFLQAVGGTAVLAAAGGVLGVLLAGRRRSIEAARAMVARVASLPEAVPPVGSDLTVPGLAPWQTPNDRFYRIDTAISLPLLTAEEWRLRLHGMVERELELDFSDLLKRGLVDRWVTLTCVSNEIGGDLVGNALWTGVPVAPLLDEAGPLGGADAVMSTSVDGWTAGTPLSVLTDGRDALLAVGMNGQPLPVEHGFPVRMVVPGLYGFVSATKWVVELEVTRFAAFDAYWTRRGWAEQAPIKPASRIDTPRDGAQLAAGRVTVAGTAWSQGHGVDAVEVRVDDGPWREATLGVVPTANTWRHWRLDWAATPGRHRLQVRATNGSGARQTERIQPPVPDGATGWHAIEVSVAG